MYQTTRTVYEELLTSYQVLCEEADDVVGRAEAVKEYNDSMRLIAETIFKYWCTDEMRRRIEAMSVDDTSLKADPIALLKTIHTIATVEDVITCYEDASNTSTRNVTPSNGGCTDGGGSDDDGDLSRGGSDFGDQPTATSVRFAAAVPPTNARTGNSNKQQTQDAPDVSTSCEDASVDRCPAGATNDNDGAVGSGQFPVVGMVEIGRAHV